MYANNSCLPQGATGYTKDRGCEIGGLPQYIVNATTERQIATALKWASHKNIRVVVKGTGHDLNGRYVTYSKLINDQTPLITYQVNGSICTIHLDA